MPGAFTLPPGFETCRNRLAVYRTHTVVSPERLAESLNEAEELLRLLTMAP